MMNTRCGGSLNTTHGTWTLYDYGRANVEYARAFSNDQIDENASRTRRIHTAGTWTLYDYGRANVEYACAFSNDQMYEKLYRTHHIHTASRSCEYACV